MERSGNSDGKCVYERCSVRKSIQTDRETDQQTDRQLEGHGERETETNFVRERERDKL